MLILRMNLYELSIQGKVENIGSINLNAVSDVYVRYVFTFFVL